MKGNVSLVPRVVNYAGRRHVNASCMRFSTNAKAQDADIRMPTPLSDGFQLIYRRSGKQDATKKRPLVIIAGWMGAKERQLKPYQKFYHDRGYDTLSFAVGPRMVLQPKMAQKQMDEILQVAYLHNEEGKESMVHEPSCLLFHHFSVGGFLYGQALQAMSRIPELSGIKDSIRAQIFDSPPDYMNIPTGISKSMGIGGPVEMIIEKLARLYLKLTENSAGVIHKAASHAFHENDTPCPSLWFYSKADPVADWRDCVIVTDKWKLKGIEVEECVWQVCMFTCMRICISID